jgi:hypothetical protein
METSTNHKVPYREATGVLDFFKRVLWNLLPSGFRGRMHQIAELDKMIKVLDAKVDHLVGNDQDRLAVQRRLAAVEDMLAEVSDSLAESKRALRQIEGQISQKPNRQKPQ